jgi:DNA polymerase epsilon subunit 1
VALELVKLICHILRLDAAVTDEVHVVRNNLLLKLGVKPYSAEAQYAKHPFAITVDLCCPYCLANSRIDLLQPAAHDNVDGFSTWKCSECSHGLPRTDVQQQLSTLLSSVLSGYQQQDVYCAKCTGIKQANIANYCSCASTFVNRVSPAHCKDFIRTIGNVARAHGFEHVAESSDWALKY